MKTVWVLTGGGEILGVFANQESAIIYAFNDLEKFCEYYKDCDINIGEAIQYLRDNDDYFDYFTLEEFDFFE